MSKFLITWKKVEWCTNEVTAKNLQEAMAKAEVGDDVFEDDPTVNRLQQQTAEMAGQSTTPYSGSEHR